MLNSGEGLLKSFEERWVIYTLLQDQKERNPCSSKEYQMFMDIIANGIESRYPSIFEYIGLNGGSVSKDVSDEVDNILEMYQTIQRSVNYFSEVEKRSFLSRNNINFSGFGSHVSERKHLIYYHFLKRYNQKEIPEETDRIIRSLEDYRGMYQMYYTILEQKQYQQGGNAHSLLNVHDIECIFSTADETKLKV